MRKVYARRYAEAVFAIALEAGRLDQWQSDLQGIDGVVGDAAMAAWLDSPKVRFEEKVRVLAERLPKIDPLAMNLLRLLVAKGKLGIIGGIAADYQRLVDQHRGIQQAEVTAAIALDDADKQKLAEKLGAIVGKRVVLKTSVDPTIIGGFVARNGKLLDASTRSKLEALKKELAGAGR